MKRRVAPLLLVVLVAIAAPACRRGGDASSAAAHDAGAASALPLASSADAEAAPARATLPARCQPTTPTYALDDGHGLDDLEIGDATSGPSGLAVEVVHRIPAGRLAAVAMLTADASSMKLRDLGPTLGDAPPPRVAWRGADLVAVAYAVSKRADVRELALYAVPPSGEPRLTGTLAEPRDDSLAYDLSPSLVVWDEAHAGTTPRGVIRIAEIAADGKPGPPRDVSPPESDAEMPRVAPTASGALVFWVARRPEEVPAQDASADEVTGEAPSYGWLEAVLVDAHGAPSGPVRRLTPASGHVSAYDVAPSPRSGARSDVVVAVRDDGEAVDGSGGALLRVRVREATQEPPVAYATDGLGRGAPAFVAPAPVEGSPAWLSWVAPREEGRLLSLDLAGIATQLPSGEPALDEARPLAWLDAGVRLLAAAPSDATSQLRVLRCSP